MKRLVVCVPGFAGSTTSWNPLLEKLGAEDAFKTAVILRFDENYGWCSTKSAVALSKALLAMIDGEWEDQKWRGEEYDDICFLAHSVGALLARRAYLLALGDRHGRVALQWATKVTRIVLFAGVNRGLCSSDDKQEGNVSYGFRRRLMRRAIELSAELPTHFLVQDLLAGSDFVTNIRLSWIRTFRNRKNSPTVVQVLGTDDQLVNENDSVDVDQFPTGHRIDLKGANHATVVTVETDDGFDRRRYAQIRKAVLGELQPTPIPDEQTNLPQTIVFVVHGIRAGNNTWVKQATQLLGSSLPDAMIVPATYWYFSAFHFLVPLLRRRRTRWFHETYSYYLSRDPNAHFHFLGHSNGTYLLGYSLNHLPAMCFNRVILAGSVLPKDFKWSSRIGDQVQQVWNHRSQRDIPVAILCAALRGLGMRDIGTAGYEGFEAIPEIHECFYHPGGHGAALGGESLPLLIKQLTEKDSPSCQPLAEELEWFSRLSRASVFLPYLVMLLVALTSYFSGPMLANWIPLTVLACQLLVFGTLLVVISVVLNII